MVRSIKVLEGDFGSLADFVSVGNDGALKLWRLSGKETFSIDAHDSFIYSVCASKDRIFTAGEDRCIKVWAKDGSGLQCVQRIEMPATSLWSLAVSPLGQVFCGASDGRLYVFGASKSDNREMLTEFDQRILSSLKRQGSDKAKLPYRDAAVLDGKGRGVSQSALAAVMSDFVIGKFVGENVIVQREDQAAVFQVFSIRPARYAAYEIVKWDGSSWQEIGQVTGGGDAEESAAGNPKDSHDFVVDVQLEGTDAPLKLAFNLTGTIT